MKKNSVEKIMKSLPGTDCGSCGFTSCKNFAKASLKNPEYLKKCVQSSAASEIKNKKWKDFLGRDYNFILDTFPGDLGPRETILPHNPTLTKQLKIKKGDVLIGRPMGMSCGCPITHCGIAIDVDQKSGIIVWCVTGPLHSRSKKYKDLGYYSAQAYEGLVQESNVEIKVGMRYWFLPRRCMLQWRHSGLINFVTKTKEGIQVRIEGLMIG